MGKLTSGERGKLPTSDFGLPGRRAFPMPDKSHAVAAERLVGRSVAAGNTTPAQAAQIRMKAKAVLNKGK